MTAKYNQRTLIWIIVILAVTNISTVGTIVYHRYLQKPVKPESATITIPESHLGRFFRDALGLTATQHEQFRTFRQAFHQQANQLTDQMQIKRNEMMEELGKENPDTVHLHALATDIGNLHRDLKHLTFEYYLEMKNVCTADQTEKLFQIFSAMVNREAEIKMPDSLQHKFRN